jgi:hypothetical protein
LAAIYRIELSKKKLSENAIRMKSALSAAVLLFVLCVTAQSQPNSTGDLFFPRARRFTFVAAADAPPNLLVNPALLAIPRGQNFSYSLF